MQDEVTSEAHALAVPRPHMICGTCGSLDVRADAYAAWNAETGAWELHSTYYQKYCETCGEVQLREVNEAEGLEIQAFAMVQDVDGSRLVQDEETPDFYDVMVSTIPTEGGDILTLHELEDMTRTQADKAVAILSNLYPNASVNCHYGEGRS